MSALITMTVEVSLSLRIYHAFQRPWSFIGIVAIGLAVVRCGAAAVLVGKLFNDNNFDQSIGTMGALLTGLLATAAAIDIVIAAAMLKFLLVKRSTPLPRYASFPHQMVCTQHIVSARRILDRLILITLSRLFHKSSLLGLTRPMNRKWTSHQHNSGPRPRRLSNYAVLMYEPIFSIFVYCSLFSSQLCG